MNAGDDNHHSIPGESLLDSINDDSIWNSIIERKESVNPDDPDIDLFRTMFEDDICRSICDEISRSAHRFSIPHKKLIPKGSSGKMRTVYQFEKEEMVALKIVSDRMTAYDHLFSDNLYSFRRSRHVGDAIRKLLHMRNLDMMWGYKADIHDYFNSIPVGPLLRDLRTDITDDRLFGLFEYILSDDRVEFRGNVIEERKGVMAGVPISAFLANYYLRDVDSFFSLQDCVYMRYADDILILSDSEEKVMGFRRMLIDMIDRKGLEMNPKKEHFFRPGESFEFLGFQVSEGCIDISSNTVRKMKGRIRRSARKIRRWMLEKDAPVLGTARALIRSFNRTFYGWDSGEFSWAAWYFSTITTTRSLHEIDLYCQDWIRYIASGRHIKKNHSLLTYDMMRDCGYRPLVSEYYKPR
ncbi:MAG: reverse transcriptase domain-containing protein [Candidatus Methanomethylophilaceae archaeon]